jgi:hypothetical protein
MSKKIAEHERMNEQRDGTTNWQKWGPYLSERQWGTVREDYSSDGNAWDYFPHDQARSRAYRWGEDGLGGVTDDHNTAVLCPGPVESPGPDSQGAHVWPHQQQGNHGEDVKEYYFYLDSTPTHSYMKMLYKYPQRAFPYGDLVAENGRRGFGDFEYELIDTGAFDDNRYFDVAVEYAKNDAEDILVRISVTNHGPEEAPCTLLPTLWFRNTWSWGYEAGPMNDVPERPSMWLEEGVVHAKHAVLGDYHLYADGAAKVLFTENETNAERLFGVGNASPHVKDAFHRFIVGGEADAVNPEQHGTKAAPVYRLQVAPGATETVMLRLSKDTQAAPFKDATQVFAARLAEADAFYEDIASAGMSDDAKRVQRQALAGMLWTKQLFYYDIEQWLAGDPAGQPPDSRQYGRNHEWQHLNNFDIISMPDKWEYPWYAGWDLAFHCIPLAMVDTEFAKDQLVLLTREWYMHPNGQLPAYEWAFGDVNPPVHAWAAWRVYEMDGARDTEFLKRIFNKMLLNFTWWVNRKDADGNNVFQGGFLGLDNISLFDRSADLPTGGHINQSDGTAWMGFYSLGMMSMALELAKDDAAYEDMAVKFYEHFLWIAQAISKDAHGGVGLWDEDDGFFYDVLQLPDGTVVPLKVRSLVGLMPLIAVETVGQQTLDRFTEFSRSINWLREHRPHLAENLAKVDVPGYGSAHLFAMPTEDRLRSILRYMLDENEFLSDYGIRSLSKAHETPYGLDIGGQHFDIQYWPAESESGLFGGNSNWRGPIWFPINYLLIESLRKYHRYYGEDFTVECPTGSGVLMTLNQVADDLSQRLSRIFLLDDNDRRPVFGGQSKFQGDTAWRDHILFHEYFHGDNGAGLGASHQTGWTGLVAELLDVQSNKDT